MELIKHTVYSGESLLQFPCNVIESWGNENCKFNERNTLFHSSRVFKISIMASKGFQIYDDRIMFKTTP